MVTHDDKKAIDRLLVKYQYHEATKKDVIGALNMYRLNYKVESFVFNDGDTKSLFKLHGTIPVNYRNNTYYIPICIWLMDTHPNNAPLCYVEPTPDMRINVSMFVDQNGKVYLPYLHDWQPNSSDLLGLIQVMIVTFGNNPPVFAKPKQPMPYPSANPYSSGGGALPYPTDNRTSYPPYPTSFNNMPPYPLATNSAMPSAGPNQNPYMPSGYPPYPMVPGGPGMTPFNGGVSNPDPTSGPGLTNQGTITEEHIKASIISAIEDKIRRQLNERQLQYEAEINTLRRTKDELLEGRSKIQEIMIKLDNEERELQKHISVLKNKEQELSKQLESLNKVDGIDVDEAVITTAPLYKQLLNSYAEEAAIEDAIYYLGEGLRTNVIDLEVFLKHVRQLSRKQFMLRALMQKCRQKAGLIG